MAVALENERVALDGAKDFPATGKAELSVELAGVVEAKDMVGLLGEEFFGSGEEPEVGIAFYNVFKVGDEVGFMLNKLGSWTVLFLVFLLLFLGGFGDEE